LTARGIFDYANNNGITLTPEGVVADYPRLCARATLAYSHGFQYVYGSGLEEKLGVSEYDLDHLEAGFENWEYSEEYDKDNDYYKMGQEIRALAGIKDDQ
jgi:hypothetical protein